MNSSKKYFITSSLPYCNNTPHLGNCVSSTLSGDIYARYKRSQGHEVVYLCGTDEYGSTTMIKARQENLTPREICDKYHTIHKQIYDWFNIQFDVWGRTSTDAQTKVTHEIFLDLYKNGYIEARTMVQMYCEHCKMFLADRYIKGTCYHTECLDKNIIANGDQCDICQKMIDVNKLINPFCYVCKNIPVPKETKHLYLKLDQLAPKIEDYLLKTNFKPNVLAIAKSWLAMGLTARCITRDLPWGTPIPKGVDDFLDQFSDKVFYVWFDAPIGYYSILANARSDWREFLQSPNLEWVSTQAKDNIPFHTIVFPGTILGTNTKYPLISQICGTNYLLYESKKFSKSEGTGLFGDQVIELSTKMGITEDYWRFYLIKIRPENGDSSFSMADFIHSIEVDLVNNIGNFINRCVSLTRLYCNGSIVTRIDDKLFLDYVIKYQTQMDDFKFMEALKLCLEFSSLGNQYIQSERPWVVAKNDINQVQKIIGKAHVYCTVLLHMLYPIIPRITTTILKSFNTNLLSLLNLSLGKEIIVKIDDTYQIPFSKVKISH